MPRRKYGHMVQKIGNPTKEKCQLCRVGRPCPLHRSPGTADDRRSSRRSGASDSEFHAADDGQKGR